MAKVQFKTYTPNEIVLFPSNLGERIPKDHPVRLLSRIVDGLMGHRTKRINVGEMKSG